MSSSQKKELSKSGKSGRNAPSSKKKETRSSKTTKNKSKTQKTNVSSKQPNEQSRSNKQKKQQNTNSKTPPSKNKKSVVSKKKTSKEEPSKQSKKKSETSDELPNFQSISSSQKSKKKSDAKKSIPNKAEKPKTSKKSAKSKPPPPKPIAKPKEPEPAESEDEWEYVIEGTDGEGEDSYTYAEYTSDYTGSETGTPISKADASTQTSASDTVLESTKPTINQQKKSVKERPLSTSAKIEKSEFEKLYDEVNELNSGVKTLKNSYGSIIKSLMAMQNRRAKKKMLAEKKQRNDNRQEELSVVKSGGTNYGQYGALLNDKYSMDNFVNQDTREETFNQLFAEVDEVNKATCTFRKVCFDQRGNFLREKYEKLSEEERFDRKTFNHLRTWIKSLNAVVSEIARSYNDDLLNMFRLV